MTAINIYLYSYLRSGPGPLIFFINGKLFYEQGFIIFMMLQLDPEHCKLLKAST